MDRYETLGCHIRGTEDASQQIEPTNKGSAQPRHGAADLETDCARVTGYPEVMPRNELLTTLARSRLLGSQSIGYSCRWIMAFYLTRQESPMPSRALIAALCTLPRTPFCGQLPSSRLLRSCADANRALRAFLMDGWPPDPLHPRLMITTVLSSIRSFSSICCRYSSCLTAYSRIALQSSLA